MKKQRLVAVGLAVILLSFGIGVQQGFSWEGAISSWTPGYFEEARINATTEFYRAGTNYTAWIDSTYLLDDGSETLDISGTFSATDINATAEFYRGGANYTAWVESLIPVGVNGVHGYSYVIYKSGATYYALDYDGDQATTDNDAEDIIEWVWSQADCGSFRTIGPGNWTLDDTIDSQNDDVTFESDWSLTFSAEAGAFNDESVVSVTHDRVTLIGLKLYGHMSSQPDHPGVYPGGPWNTQRGVNAHCDDLMVIRLYVYNVTQYGLYWGAGKNAVVAESIFEFCAWNGVEFGTGASFGKIIASHAKNCSDVGFALYGDNCMIIACSASGLALDIGSTSYTWGAGIEGRDNNQIYDFIGYNLDIGIGIGADLNYNPENWLVDGAILYNITNTCVQVGYGPGTLSNIRFNVTVNGIVLSNYAVDIEINNPQGYGVTGDTLIKIDSQSRIRIKGGALYGDFTYGIEMAGICTDIAIIGVDIGVGYSANTAIIGGASDDVDDLRIQNCYIEATTGLDLDSGSRIFLTANKWDCTNPINVANANCNPVYMFLNEWDGSTNNATITGATVVHGLNIATNGGIWDGT